MVLEWMLKVREKLCGKCMRIEITLEEMINREKLSRWFTTCKEDVLPWVVTEFLGVTAIDASLLGFSLLDFLFDNVLVGCVAFTNGEIDLV